MPRTHTVYPMKWQVVTGSVSYGFYFWGTFDTKVEAGRWAASNLTPVELKTYTIEPINIIPEDWG